MKIFVFLSLLSLVYTAPTPNDETLEVVPYVHQETPEEEAADQPEAAALPVVSYSYAPLAPVAVTKYTSVPQVGALISPFHLVAGYKTGCVNSVGSVVPCHL